jgi:alpha-tubulin suppressor-like RCC1 family protein
MQIKDAFDSLEQSINSDHGKSALIYIKSQYIKLSDYSKALEGYIKYRNEPFTSVFSNGSRLPIPQRISIPNQRLELFAIGQNDDGQLGLSREMILATTKFRKLSSVENLSMIACGSMHSILVDSFGTVYTFGIEDCIGSREGDDDQICQVSLSINALHVCCGEYFTAIMDINGNVWYFGGFRNRLGERLFYEKLPKKVHLDLPAVKIASGESHLLILCQDMTCYILGAAEFGQALLPTSSSTPVKLYLTQPVLDIYASGFSSFFMTTNGIYACGNNGYGELGIGNYNQSNHPQIVLFPLQTEIIDILGGMHHTLFLDGYGQLWVTGKNFDGQLGLPLEMETICTPVKVEIEDAKYPIRKIAAGTSSHHSCRVIIKYRLHRFRRDTFLRRPE